MSPPLPSAFGVSLDGGTRRVDGGRVLVGGSPLTIMRLSSTGSAVLDALDAGTPVSAAGGGAGALGRRLVDAGIAHPRPPDGVRPTGQVTVVIPVRDDAIGLAATVAAIGTAAAVVIVDDGSVDESRVLELACATGARLLRHAAARGPGAARNTGWRSVVTDLVAFVDAGCEPEPGWLQPLLGHLDDPAVAAAAPRVVASAHPEAPAWMLSYESHRSPLDLGPQPSIVRPRAHVAYVPTAALVVRRSALDLVGGFDESLLVGEDVDLVWRLTGSVRYEPAALVRHPTRDRFGAMVRQRYRYGTSAAPLAARHGRAVAPLRISPWTAVAWLLAAVGRPALGAGVVVGTMAALPRKLRELDHPWRESMRLAGRGQLAAWRPIATAVMRAWWPVGLVASLCSRRARFLMVAAAVVPPLVARRRERASVDPITWIALHVVDDVAYGAGVWAGAVRQRSIAALQPDLVRWPPAGAASSASRRWRRRSRGAPRDHARPA